jgi:serine/threonine-protein kinase
MAAAIVVDIAHGLSAAHAAGVVHRDLKPANVFVHEEADGSALVKVVDFGVSKVLDAGEISATTTGFAIGSPGYMSPEQARGDRDIDHRSDLWSLGVLLFELVTGEMPFVGATVFEVVANILHGEIPRLRDRIAVDDRLDALVECCLQRDREQRPSSASEVVRRLESVAAVSYSHVVSSVSAAPAVTTADELAITEPSDPLRAPLADDAAATLTAGALSTGVGQTRRGRSGARGRWGLLFAIGGAGLLAAAAVVSLNVMEGTPAVERAQVGMFSAAWNEIPAPSSSAAPPAPSASAAEPPSTLPPRPPPAARWRRPTPAPAKQPPSQPPKPPSGLALPASPD